MSKITVILLFLTLPLLVLAFGLLVEYVEMKRGKRFSFRQHLGPIWGTKKSTNKH